MRILEGAEREYARKALSRFKKYGIYSITLIGDRVIREDDKGNYIEENKTTFKRKKKAQHELKK